MRNKVVFNIAWLIVPIFVGSVFFGSVFLAPGTQAAETPTTDSEPASSETVAAPDITANQDEVQPGNLRETVNRTLQLFVPSEEIDVDKPVDFPSNI